MPVAELTRALAPFGLNLIGVTTLAAYDAIVPASHRLGASSDASNAARRAIIVIGNGGGALWAAFRDEVRHHPEYDAQAHPLDDFTARVLATHALPIAERMGLRPVLHLPFRDTPSPMSFVHLAEAAGLGRRSVLGVLVHPEFGPWMALRGALMVEAASPAARPAAGFDPCSSCRDRPCVAACPGAAVVHPDGWNIPRCIAFRVDRAEQNPCVDRCHARVACVYGRHHVYPPDALRYHQRRAFAVMRSHR